MVKSKKAEKEKKEKENFYLVMTTNLVTNVEIIYSTYLLQFTR